MPSCNQEEANIHDAIHALNGIYPGFQKIVIQTIDTDVIVVLVHHFKNVQTLNENVKFFLSHLGLERTFSCSPLIVYVRQHRTRLD